MKTIKEYNYLTIIWLFCIAYASCKIPAITPVKNIKPAPAAYNNLTDTSNFADTNWKLFFSDKNLVALIDTAINNNPDVLITLQEIEVARNEVRARNGELYPKVMAGGAIGVEKVGRYTSQGAGDASAEITPGKTVPEHLTDMYAGFRTSWEVDVWGKLRSAKKAAFAKYLSTIEGKNFVRTNLIAEVANTYYELLAFDSQLDIIRENIQLQKNQLEIVKVQKEAAAATELGVKQLEAQVYNSQTLEYEVLQKIVENENKINFLLGRYPQAIVRDKTTLLAELPHEIKAGIPSQLLRNRPDIQQAALELLAAKWDVKTAQLAFYPSLSITNVVGIQAFKPSYLFKMPESILYSLIGDLAGPILNRNAIIAQYKTANAYQIKAMYNYQKIILNGYVEVANELSNINNLQQRYNLKSKEVDALTKSIDISKDLFKAARATYLEVLIAQRDALSSKLELVEFKKLQYAAMTNIYKALGGGWK